MNDEEPREDGVPRLQLVAGQVLHVASAWFAGMLAGAWLGDVVTGSRGWLYSADARYFVSLAQGAFTLSIAAAVLARRRAARTWRRLALESVAAAVAVQLVSLGSTVVSLAGPEFGPLLVAEPTGSPALAERYARQFLHAYLGFEPYAIVGATALGLGLCAHARGRRWEGLALAAPLVGVPSLIDMFRTWPGMKPTDGPDRVFLVAAALAHVAVTATWLALANSRARSRGADVPVMGSNPFAWSIKAASVRTGPQATIRGGGGVQSAEDDGLDVPTAKTCRHLYCGEFVLARGLCRGHALAAAVRGTRVWAVLGWSLVVGAALGFVEFASLGADVLSRAVFVVVVGGGAAGSFTLWWRHRRLLDGLQEERRVARERASERLRPPPGSPLG